MQWMTFVMAAMQTVSSLAPEVLAQFHGGASATASKVGSALAVIEQFIAGTASQLTASDVHPDLAAHAATLTPPPSAVPVQPQA